VDQQITSLVGEQGILVRYTDKPVTPWGGLVLFSGLARQVGLEEALRKALPFHPTSPNATDPVEVVLAFMAGVLVGSRRLAQIERLRWDEGVRRILGLKRFVSDTTLSRFFRRFTLGTVTTVFESLMKWELAQVSLEEGEVLDLDSSAVERFGKQEGAVLGYNPKKHRRPSHHPLIATLGKRPWVVHSWLRSGNTSSARGAEAFLDESVGMLPEGARIRFLRADSGFGVEPFLKRVEDRGFQYAISARFTKGLKNLVPVVVWRSLEPGIEVSETKFRAQGWSCERRVVLVRQRTKADDFVRGRELFDDPAYAYQAILTNRGEAPEDMKWDYGIDGFCQKKFFATEAAFRLVCVTHNLMTLLQEKLGFVVHRTLGTLRANFLACGAVVGRSGRRLVLRMSLSGPWRERFRGYLATVFPTSKANCGAVGTG
jgi:hypothetical protein